MVSNLLKSRTNDQKTTDADEYADVANIRIRHYNFAVKSEKYLKLLAMMCLMRNFAN